MSDLLDRLERALSAGVDPHPAEPRTRAPIQPSVRGPGSSDAWGEARGRLRLLRRSTTSAQVLGDEQQSLAVPRSRNLRGRRTPLVLTVIAWDIRGTLARVECDQMRLLAGSLRARFDEIERRGDRVDSKELAERIFLNQRLDEDYK